jgi:hypothetical protein
MISNLRDKFADRLKTDREFSIKLNDYIKFIETTSPTLLEVSSNINNGCSYRTETGNFLDAFYDRRPEIQSLMIKDPPLAMENREYLPKLAAIAHKLSNDFGLDLPTWTMEPRCFLPDDDPYVTLNLKGEAREWLRQNSPPEFKLRNLYVCSNILTRI